MQTPRNEFTFFLNKNKYVLYWENSCTAEMRYLLLNYFIEYLKKSWSSSDICIKVFFSNKARE